MINHCLCVFMCVLLCRMKSLEILPPLFSFPSFFLVKCELFNLHTIPATERLLSLLSWLTCIIFDSLMSAILVTVTFPSFIV